MGDNALRPNTKVKIAPLMILTVDNVFQAVLPIGIKSDEHTPVRLKDGIPWSPWDRQMERLNPENYAVEAISSSPPLTINTITFTENWENKIRHRQGEKKKSVTPSLRGNRG